ncbi:MAG: amino acid permease [Phycisphaerales bacterium]
MLVAENRPRNLNWIHAGPLLFGDWGTSRLYVLGLAFYYTGHASVTFLAVMSVIMIAVAWAYTVVCRSFPDGGGVYAAARQISPTLSVVGATLLLCDYTVTASLSAVEGFHYIGVPHHWVVGVSIVAVLIIGLVNWFGAQSAGRFALFIAIVAIFASGLVALMCLPMLPDGLRALKVESPGVETLGAKWESLVRIVLALSGVEAVANMTGLMKEPVDKTAKRTIWPVLIEVVTLNLIFAIALNALPQLSNVTTPDYVTHEVVGKVASDQVPAEVREYRDTAVKLLATHSATDIFGAKIGSWIGTASGIIFGLLLLSAVNTAIMAIVSVFYSLSKDRELPPGLAKLNYSGVPRWGLALAGLLPLGVLAFEADPKALGELYAIGVVGAIAINVLCCAANRELKVTKLERIGLWTLGVVMSAIELTIIIKKPHATIFAGGMIVAVLGIRWIINRRAATMGDVMPEPEKGWMAELKTLSPTIPQRPHRIMLAARGRDQAEYAVQLAKKQNAALFAIFVRTVRLLDVQPGKLPRLEDDPDAQSSLGTVMVVARDAGVPFYPIYVTSPDVASEILDYTVTFGCDTLIMGKSRRSLFSRRIAGDVISKVAQHLPDEVSLVTRSAN